MEHAKLMYEMKTWKDHPGKREYIKILSGEVITMKQAIMAECYRCTAGYFDGRKDCENTTCGLYPFMRYRKQKITRPKKKRSEKQLANDKKLRLKQRSPNKSFEGGNSETEG